jgi:hypothetical protein
LYCLNFNKGVTWRKELKELVKLELDGQRREDGVVDQRRPEIGQSSGRMQPRIFEQLSRY